MATKRDGVPPLPKQPPTVHFDVSGEAITPTALASFDQDSSTPMSPTAAFILNHKKPTGYSATSGQAADSPRLDPEDDLPPADWRCVALNREERGLYLRPPECSHNRDLPLLPGAKAG